MHVSLIMFEAELTHLGTAAPLNPPKPSELARLCEPLIRDGLAVQAFALALSVVKPDLPARRVLIEDLAEWLRVTPVDARRLKRLAALELREQSEDDAPASQRCTDHVARHHTERDLYLGEGARGGSMSHAPATSVPSGLWQQGGAVQAAREAR